MKAVVTVVGRDTVGILAKVSASCAEHNANIIDVTQSVMQELFTMVMLVDIAGINTTFENFRAEMAKTGEELGMEINVQLEEIFESMYRV